MKYLLIWASGFAAFAGLQMLDILPPPTGPGAAGALVMVAALIMLAIASDAK